MFKISHHWKAWFLLLPLEEYRSWRVSRGTQQSIQQSGLSIVVFWCLIWSLHPDGYRYTVDEHRTNLMAAHAEVFLLKFTTIIYTISSMFSSRLLWLHQTASHSTSFCMQTHHCPWWGQWMLSMNFGSLTDWSVEVQSVVYRKKTSGESSLCLFQTSSCSVWPNSLSHVQLLVDHQHPDRQEAASETWKIHIQPAVEGGTESLVRLNRRRFGMMVSNAELFPQTGFCKSMVFQMLHDVVQSHVACIIQW